MKVALLCSMVIGAALGATVAKWGEEPEPMQARHDACVAVMGTWACSGWNCWCSAPVCTQPAEPLRASVSP